MDQLTQDLADATCKLSVILQALQQQELLVETLRTQGRPTMGAELLLVTFKNAAAAIFDHRQYLEEQVIRLACEAKPSIQPGIGTNVSRKARWAPNVYLWLTRAKEFLLHYGR